MNQQEIAGRVHLSMYRQLQKDGVARGSGADGRGVLSAGDYENWRFGRVDYLEGYAAPISISSPIS
jgi:hypothetical protein